MPPLYLTSGYGPDSADTCSHTAATAAQNQHHTKTVEVPQSRLLELHRTDTTEKTRTKLQQNSSTVDIRINRCIYTLYTVKRVKKKLKSHATRPGFFLYERDSRDSGKLSSTHNIMLVGQ